MKPENASEPKLKVSNLPWYAKGSQRLPAKVKSQILQKIAKRVGFFSILVIFLFTASFNLGNKTNYFPDGRVQIPPTLAGLAGGCRGISTWPSPAASEIGWVSPGNFFWHTLPPISGNFDMVPWKTSGYIEPTAIIQPTIPAAVSNLYRGWVVIWTSRDAKEGSLDGLLAWAKTMAPGNPVLVAQWPILEPGTWPTGRNVLLTAWGQAESCLIFDAKATEEFRVAAKKHSAPGYGISLDEPGPAAQVRTYDLIEQR